MLTWAMVYLYIHGMKDDYEPNGVWFVIAMCCDVAAIYYIASAIVGKAL